MRSYTNLKTFFGKTSQNTSQTNLDLFTTMANHTQRIILEKYFNNETSFQLNTVANQQAYKFPQNYSKMKTVQIQVGAINYPLQEVLTRKEWDLVNMYQWTSNIPAFYFIYNGVCNIFPIPSSVNTMTFNYKLRATDLSIDDTSTGTVSVTAGGTVITGSGTGWNPTTGINESRWIQIPFPTGDNQWYQIASVDSATQITLYNAYQGTVNVVASPYTMGQMPIIMEDFHDILVYEPLMLYFASIQPNSQKFEQWKEMYDRTIKRLDEYAGSKSTGISLEGSGFPINGNLFQQNLSQV